MPFQKKRTSITLIPQEEKGLGIISPKAILLEDMELDIAAMNLVVIPVSLKLLLEPNRAMDVDFPFAKDHGITVLR